MDLNCEGSATNKSSSSSLLSRPRLIQEFSDLDMPLAVAQPGPIQNTLVQSIELQGWHRGGTGKSRQNSSGTGIAKLACAAPLIIFKLTANTEVVSVKEVPPAKVMSLWNRGTGIAQFAGAAPLMTV